MAIELFGFKIEKTSQALQLEKNVDTFVPPTADDGAVEVVPGGVYGTYVDLEGTSKTEAELVTRYRDMSRQPECDSAIEDVVNEAITMDDNTAPVDIILDNLKQPQSIKNKIKEEFDSIMELLNFGNVGYEIFKRWYVDGRIYYHLLIDTKNPRAGIKELRYIDPRKIRKIREPITEKDKRTGAKLYKGYNEYYIYSQKGLINSNDGLKIAADSICYVNSGILDSKNNLVLGHLHKAIKPLNQLRMLEDATIIYRLARAPERRIFYIDVGNLPKIKAEQYIRDMMVKHKNRLVYDAQTGEVRDDRKFMTMLEDFWLPRREGGRGTEITTLPGGQNLGEMDDVNYFKKNLYRSLNVPVARIESETQFNLGRSSEITRDEVKFSKFIRRLRNKFSTLFDNLLEIQLALKGIATRAEWQEMRNHISYDYIEDNHFTELKEAEILSNRLNILGTIDPLVGRYFSMNWVRKNVLRLNEEEIKAMEEEIGEEERMRPDTEQGTQEQDDEPQQRPPQQPPQAQSPKEEEFPVEEFKPRLEISEEDKRLIERMTNIMDKTSYDVLEDGNG